MKRSIDPHTGELFYPLRSNQKFATRENQIAFNNAKAKEKRDYLNEFDSCVRRNWEILVELLGDDRKTTKTEEFRGTPFLVSHTRWDLVISPRPLERIA